MPRRRSTAPVLERARPQLEGGSGPTRGDEYKDAFAAYVKRGEEKALSHRLQSRWRLSGAERDRDARSRRLMAALSPIRAIAARARRSRPRVYKKPVTMTGPAAGWVAETAARPQTDSQTHRRARAFRRPSSTPCRRRPAAFLDDAAVDVGQWIAEEVNAAFAEQEGDGLRLRQRHQQAQGLPRLDARWPSASWAWGKLGYVATGVAGALPASDRVDVLIDLVYALKAGYRQNASWVMNRKTPGRGAQAQGR